MRIVGPSRRMPSLVMLVETVKEVETAEEDMMRERFRVVWDLFAGPSVDAYGCTFCVSCVGWGEPRIKSEYSSVSIHIL